MAQLRCTKCDTEVVKWMNYCPDCGEEIFWKNPGDCDECSRCGTPVHPKFMYCFACGLDFEENHWILARTRGFRLSYECDNEDCPGKVAHLMLYCPWCGEQQQWDFDLSNTSEEEFMACRCGGKLGLAGCGSAVDPAWFYCTFCGRKLPGGSRVKPTLVETMAKPLKPIADVLTRGVKKGEEWLAEDAVILEKFDKSVQMDGYSCGVQCTYMILRYYGNTMSVGDVERALGTTRDGTDQHQIRSLLLREGLTPTRINLPNLRKVKQAIKEGYPVLVCVDQGDHWVVIYGYAKKVILTADPARLRGAYDTREFTRRWDRWAMVVKPTGEC
jgi:hypothetical protein